MSNGDPRYDFFYPSITLILFLVWVIWSALDVMVLIAYHARISGIFIRGGPGQSDEKSSDNVFFVFFLVLSLFYRSQMVNFKEIYHFSRFQRGSTFSRGGGPNFFQGGGGGGGGPIAYSL